MEKDIEDRVKEADDLIRQRKPNLAVAILKEVVRISSQEPYPYYLLGIVRMKCGRFFLAKKALEKADQLLPNNADNLRTLGWVKVMLGEIEEGRKNLREAISLDLTNPLAYLDLATSYFNNLEFEKGSEWLERAKALNPNDPFVLQNCKINEDMKKDFSGYSKAQLEKMRKDRLKPESRQNSRLYILEKSHRGKNITEDDQKEIKEELENILSSGPLLFKNKKQKHGEEFFDDCPICQVTKKAREEGREPTEEELKEAFLKSKDQGAIVGGEW